MWTATIQYSFGSKRSAICAQVVHFLHSTMLSVTCLRLSDVGVMCLVTHFQFPIQVCFSSMSARQAAQRRIGLRNIGYRTLLKIWVGTFLVRDVHPEELFWIDYNGKAFRGKVRTQIKSKFLHLYLCQILIKSVSNWQSYNKMYNSLLFWNTV